MINWTNYFDKIYCLHLIDYKDRKRIIDAELNRIGIDTKADYFEYKITVKNEFYKYIWSNTDCKVLDWIRPYVNCLNCTMGHYEIFKEAEAEGFNKILIIEDDEVFLKDINVIEESLNNLPDYDVCLFDKCMDCNKIEQYKDKIFNNMINNYYFNHSLFYKDELHFTSTGCYALSKAAITNFIKNQENFFVAADFITAKPNEWYSQYIDDSLIRISINKNIAVQCEKSNYKDRFNTIYKYIRDVENCTSDLYNI